VIIQVGGNTLDCDVEATIAAFQAHTPRLCDCNGCRNFRAAREVIFTGPVVSLFSQFGIDTAKPAEIYTLGPPGQDSRIMYGGWFHFVGQAISYDDVVDIGEELKVYFLTRPALLPKSFKNQPTVQLEFEWQIPWMLPEPWAP
jgi:hypothetical protein